MKKLFSFLGLTYRDGSISFITMAFYAIGVKLILSPTIETDIALLVVGMIYVYDRYFHEKNTPATITHEPMDLSILRGDVEKLKPLLGDVDKLKLALSVKEFKR